MKDHEDAVLNAVEKSLSEKLGQKVEVKTSGFLGGGCINHASKIETNAGTFFLKWNSENIADTFVREAESLNELKKAAQESLVIPEVYAAKKTDETPGFLVLEYLNPHPSSPDDNEKLGEGLATIHKYSNKQFGFYNNNYCGATLQNNQWKQNWADFYANNRLRFLLKLIEAKRPLPSSEAKIYDKIIDRIPELLPFEAKPVLIHGDLWSGNYMITE